MRSVMCASCGLVGWAETGNCKRCGQPLPFNQQPPGVSTPRDYNAGYDYNYAPTPDYFGAPSKKQNGYAVASLVIGIVGFFTLGILLIGSIVGTSLGIVALTKQGRRPAVYGGKGLAVAGIVVNIAAVFMIVPIGIISAIAIPNLLAASRMANEAAAISSLRVISSAEATYASTTGAGDYGSLPQLSSAGLLDNKLARGAKSGYVFTVIATGRDFQARATPLTPMSGNRSFYVSSTGVIHSAPGVRPATESDPPMYFNGSQYDPRYDTQPQY